MSSDATLKGWLLKMKRTQNKFLPQWNRRWFELQGTKVVWYRRKGGPVSGTISLFSCTSVDRFESGKQGIHSFVIRSSQRNYYLRADNDAQVDYWRNGLLMQMDLMAGGTTQGPPTRKNRRRKQEKKGSDSDSVSRAMESLKELEAILAAEEQARGGGIDARSHSRTSTHSSRGSTRSGTHSTRSNSTASAASLPTGRDGGGGGGGGGGSRTYTNTSTLSDVSDTVDLGFSVTQPAPRHTPSRFEPESPIVVHQRGERILTGPRQRQGEAAAASSGAMPAGDRPWRDPADTPSPARRTLTNETNESGVSTLSLHDADGGSEDLKICHLDLDPAEEVRWPEEALPSGGSPGRWQAGAASGSGALGHRLRHPSSSLGPRTSAQSPPLLANREIRSGRAPGTQWGSLVKGRQDSWQEPPVRDLDVEVLQHQLPPRADDRSGGAGGKAVRRSYNEAWN